MELSKAELEQLEDLAYSLMKLSDIAVVLELDETQLCEAALNPGNPVHAAYQRGKLRSKASIQKAIVEAAASGSTPAQKLAFDLMTMQQEELDRKT